MTTNASEAWALRMIEDLERSKREGQVRRDELALSVEALAGGIARLGSEQWKSAKGSASRADAKALRLTLGNRTESVSDVIGYESSINLLSAADQLRGFAVLLRAEASLMGAVSVSRGVYESCLWATALIDPTITSDERLQRALTRRLARLSAGIRLNRTLGEGPSNDQSVAMEDPAEDDRHGSNRDPHRDIDDILTYARGRGWPVKKARRAWEVTPLSIDWLTENLERRIGIEGYAWTSESSMAHGEHAADTASWIELSHDIGSAPAWLIRMWSTGVLAGPRLLLATFADYTGRVRLGAEYQRFERAFWEVGIKGGNSS